MNSSELLIDILNRIKTGEYVGLTNIEVSYNYPDGLQVLKVFNEIERNNYIVFKTVGIGEIEIIGLTEKGNNFLKK